MGWRVGGAGSEEEGRGEESVGRAAVAAAFALCVELSGKMFDDWTRLRALCGVVPWTSGARPKVASSLLIDGPHAWWAQASYWRLGGNAKSNFLNSSALINRQHSVATAAYPLPYQAHKRATWNRHTALGSPCHTMTLNRRRTGRLAPRRALASPRSRRWSGTARWSRTPRRRLFPAPRTGSFSPRVSACCSPGTRSSRLQVREGGERRPAPQSSGGISPLLGAILHDLHPIVIV